ncbi:unnamed protein product [Ixodes persulcatus]
MLLNIGILTILNLAILLITAASKDCSPPPDYDAWKYLRSFNDGYIDYEFRNGTTLCLTLSIEYVAEDQQVAVYNVSSRTMDNPSIQRKLIIYEVEDCSDKIAVFNSSGTRIWDLKLLYTNYNDCGVLAFGTDYERCAVWLSTDASEEGIESCLGHYNESCGGIHNVYPKNVGSMQT